MGVLAGEGGREGVLVGDVATEHWIEAVGILVWKAMWDEDSELVGGVWIRAKKRSKIDVTDGRPLLLGAEFGTSAVPQLDC